MKHNRKSIFVPLESFLYLHSEFRRQRSGRIMSERERERLEKSFANFCYKSNGMYAMMDGALGGCNGPHENAYEEGRWTSWSAQDMAKMLDAAGLPWEAGPDIECIEVGLW